MELDSKYVFHIPLYKYEDNRLTPLEIDDILCELFDEFHKKGFEGMYVSKVKSRYKGRDYSELLVTLFTTEDKSPEEIFERWFVKNNEMLKQDEFAYEKGNAMTIVRLVL